MHWWNIAGWYLGPLEIVPYHDLNMWTLQMLKTVSKLNFVLLCHMANKSFKFLFLNFRIENFKTSQLLNGLRFFDEIWNLSMKFDVDYSCVKIFTKISKSSEISRGGQTKIDFWIASFDRQDFWHGLLIWPQY